MSNPKGIFDRSTKGKKTSPVTVDIEKGQIRFFCKTIGETNPIHFSRSKAILAGYPDVVAPITFPIAIIMAANELIVERGSVPGMAMINCDFRRLLHGTERYDYHGLIHAGDQVQLVTEVAGFEDKKGGLMELAFLKYYISHETRGLLVTVTSTAIHRLG